jgi:hypothetical protein
MLNPAGLMAGRLCVCVCVLHGTKGYETRVLQSAFCQPASRAAYVEHEPR